MTENAKAAWLRQGDMLESVGEQKVGKRVHQIDWGTWTVKARYAVQSGDTSRVRVVLSDHTELVLTPETEVSRTPWAGRFTPDSYTEYEVVFEWVEWIKTDAPCGGYFKATSPARERTCFILAIDRKGAADEGRAALGLVEWANETTEEPGWRKKRVRRVRVDEPVVCVLDEPVPDKPGYIRQAAGRTLGEIHHDVTESLGEMVDEYFSGPRDWRSEELGPSDQWPENVRWVACYAVTGGSEGWYIHIDLIRELDLPPETDAFGAAKRPRSVKTASTIMLGKTFQGMEHAQKIAAKVAQLLGA